MNKRYLVVFSGFNETKDLFTSRMSGLGVSTAILEEIIEKSPVIMKSGMLYEEAKRYADAVRKAGGIVEIREQTLIKAQDKEERSLDIEPLENFTMCPQCGYKQHKKEVCVKCGFILKKD